MTYISGREMRYNVLNEDNSAAAFEAFKYITTLKKYNSLKYDDRKYVLDRLYRDLFLTPPEDIEDLPKDIRDITTEEVNTHSKIEKELKGIFADKLGVDDTG